MLTLGHFGDVRLEKGGSIFWVGWLRLGASASVFVGLEAIGRGRSALHGFCGTGR